MFVEGNADLAPAKLIGHHNPARVLREDYSEDNFVDGPLLEAMRGRRVPVHRGVQPGSRGHLEHPAHRHGGAAGGGAPGQAPVTAKPTFRVIASMNPYDENVGTTRLSTSVRTTGCARLAISYQDAEAERGIVALRAPLPDMDPELFCRLVANGVAVTRATPASTRTSGRAAACAARST